MGCCVGGLSKSHLISDRQSKRDIRQPSRRRRREWSTGPKVMENNVSMSHSLDAHLSSCPPTLSEENKSTEENVTTVSFINHAAIAWHERRREWIGDQSKRNHRPTREPIISWSTTYEDLLTNNHPFSQPIPLSEMIDFLVDIWQEEGLYD
ncbi:uncharacterized protein A4U43_C10F15340 [Asparagus officinalis]|uniref:Gag1-like clamp domain-containing protein n=1 Tax=Asparagus officinalis TaxID=4686 RepID=A0A5P1E4T6_ASPOF|nr:uncharacterized protein A4U43_C10F15340 [Asparagus officinalis]